jgi:hypothetical protein
MDRVLFALLVCTDCDCAAYHEAYGTPEELDALSCELCGCGLQAVGWAEAAPNGARSAAAQAVERRAEEDEQWMLQLARTD